MLGKSAACESDATPKSFNCAARLSRRRQSRRKVTGVPSFTGSVWCRARASRLVHPPFVSTVTFVTSKWYAESDRSSTAAHRRRKYDRRQIFGIFVILIFRTPKELSDSTTLTSGNSCLAILLIVCAQSRRSLLFNEESPESAGYFEIVGY